MYNWQSVTNHIPFRWRKNHLNAFTTMFGLRVLIFYSLSSAELITSDDIELDFMCFENTCSYVLCVVYAYLIVSEYIEISFRYTNNNLHSLFIIKSV